MAVAELESVDEFEKAINQDKMLVQFHATWCSPCKAVTPIVVQIGEDREVLRVDIDQFPDLAKQYDVMTIPTLIDFRAGEPTVTSIGIKSKAALIRDFAV